MGFVVVEIGETVGSKYLLAELLGVGGMGKVFLASHIEHPEFFVAVKVLDPDLVTDNDAKGRFRNEVLAGYRVNHPNVVTMFEYFDLGAVQAFAMEYVKGGDLLTLLGNGALSTARIVSILLQLSRALEALHRQGTIHRDLKPENVLLSEGDLLKLSDFGVARVLGRPLMETEGMLAGTLKYLAPEYTQTREFDHRSDIYSFGVLAYEMVAGESPFRAKTEISLMQERVDRKDADLSARFPEAHPRLAEIVEKCLGNPVPQRYQNASYLVEDLEALAHELGIVEMIPGARPPVDRDQTVLAYLKEFRR